MFTPRDRTMAHLHSKTEIHDAQLSETEQKADSAENSCMLVSLFVEGEVRGFKSSRKNMQSDYFRITQDINVRLKLYFVDLSVHKL